MLFPRAAPVKFVARLCCILLCSAIFCFACFVSQTSGLGSAFSSSPVKSVTRFCYALVRNLFGLFCLTNTGFVQCYSLGSRKVCCTLVFNFALFSNFCFACFASHANIGVVQCFSFGSCKVGYTLLLRFSQNFVLRVFPHKHRARAVLFPLASLKFTPFWFSSFYSVCFCYACFAQQAPLCAVIFPRFPSNLHALFFCFVLFSFKFVFCVLSLTNLILPSIPAKLVHHFCCICALFGQSVRRVLFYTVYSDVISSSPVDFE